MNRLLEDDGRNSTQLLSYAGLRHYIQVLIVERAESQTPGSRWFRQPVVDTLILWIYWLINDRGKRPQNYHITVLTDLIIQTQFLRKVASFDHIS